MEEWTSVIGSLVNGDLKHDQNYHHFRVSCQISCQVLCQFSCQVLCQVSCQILGQDLGFGHVQRTIDNLRS